MGAAGGDRPQAMVSLRSRSFLARSRAAPSGLLVPLTLGVIVKFGVELYRGPAAGQEFNIFVNLRTPPEGVSRKTSTSARNRKRRQFRRLARVVQVFWRRRVGMVEPALPHNLCKQDHVANWT